MLGQQTQTIIQIAVTPDEMQSMIRSIFREELASYVPPAPKYPDLPEFMTRKEAAALLQISRATLNSWARDTTERRKLIQPIKTETGLVRYRKQDVLALLSQKDQLLHNRNWNNQ